MKNPCSELFNANSILGYIGKNAASRSVKVILALCLALLRHFWDAGPSFGLPREEAWRDLTNVYE